MTDDSKTKNRISMLAFSCILTAVSIYNLDCVPESTAVIKGYVAEVASVGRVRARLALMDDKAQYITRRGYTQELIRSRLTEAGSRSVELTVDTQDFGRKQQVLALSAGGFEIIALGDSMDNSSVFGELLW